MPRTPNCADRFGLASVSTFTRRTAPRPGLDRRLEHGRQRAARSAPLGPEVDQHRRLERGVEDLLLEVALVGVEDEHDRILRRHASDPSGYNRTRVQITERFVRKRSPNDPPPRPHRRAAGTDRGLPRLRRARAAPGRALLRRRPPPSRPDAAAAPRGRARAAELLAAGGVRRRRHRGRVHGLPGVGGAVVGRRRAAPACSARAASSRTPSSRSATTSRSAAGCRRCAVPQPVFAALATTEPVGRIRRRVDHHARAAGRGRLRAERAEDVDLERADRRVLHRVRHRRAGHALARRDGVRGRARRRGLRGRAADGEDRPARDPDRRAVPARLLRGRRPAHRRRGPGLLRPDGDVRRVPHHARRGRRRRRPRGRRVRRSPTPRSGRRSASASPTSRRSRSASPTPP